MEIIVDLCNQHHGSLAELKRMSLNAWASGADVVKVQLMDSVKFFGNTDKQYRDIDYDTLLSLKQFCDLQGIPLMATAFDRERLGWLRDLKFERHKIASRTVKEDPDLCEEILKDDKPTIISTGACAIGEFPFGHGDKITYLFCVSKYPTFLHDEDLKRMPDKFMRYGYCGYSDHTVGIAAPLKAYLNGASILEKHYSENVFAQSKFEGGHLGSFDSTTLKNFKDLIKELEILNGRKQYGT